MENNKSFFEKVKKVTVIFILVFLIIYLLLSGIFIYSNYKKKVKSLKEEYIAEKKYEVKREVLYAVEYIKSELTNFDIMMKDKAKDEISNVCVILGIIKNRGEHGKDLFFKKFLEQLDDRNEGMYYFFIDKKNKNFWCNLKLIKNDIRFLNKLIADINKDGEGFFDFLPEENKKIEYKVYVKYYKPLNIITGIIIDKNKYFNKLKSKILKVLVNIRFGKEGYIFVNQFDGTALISNGHYFYGRNKKLWELSSDYPLKEVKEVFNKELRGAQKDSGDFIFYEWIKLTNFNKVSRKVSFIYGIKGLDWIVGAGVYLDDVDNEIAFLSKEARKEFLINFIVMIVIIFLLIVSLFIVFNKINQRLKNHFNVFISFFNSAAFSDKRINEEKIEYIEFKEMSKYANKMLEDKKKYQENLLNEREKLMITLKSIGDAVVVTNAKGEIEILNKEAERLLGVKLIDVENHHFEEYCRFIRGKDGEELLSPIEQVLKTKEKIYLEGDVVLVSSNGKKYNITDSAAPILDGKNNLIGVIAVFRDITEQLKLEKQMMRNEKLEAIGILAGGIAHDFNNLLTGVFGNIELAILNLHLGKIREANNFLNIARDALERTKNLTKQLLIFSKGGDPILETVSLESIIKDIAQFDLSGSNIRLNMYIDNNVWNIKADEGQISNVLSNIIINAKQVMDKGGNIYIRAYNIEEVSHLNPDCNGKYVCIEIEDEGPGIKPELIDRIFDPYFTTKDTGHGLGLAVVHSIIKRHKGFINVKSELGKGTIFYIYLPADISDIDSKKNHAGENNIHFEGNVLIMDDIDLVSAVAKEILNNLGFDVDIVTNSKDAIEKYKASIEKSKVYDLVILDLTIPGDIGGEEVAKEILKINPDAKIVVASGYSNSPILSNYKKYGFIDRIEKPFTYEELKEIVIRIFNG